MQAVPVLHVVGTHYDVGYAIGSTFKERIQSFWKESVDVNTVDIPFHKTDEGKAFFSISLAGCKKNFPQYVQEIEGMAAGAGMTFDELFILNISKEVHNVLSKHSRKAQSIKETAGCTDVLINSPSCKLIGHNEDCDPAIKPYGYFVSARILNDDGSERENWIAYCYPGVLAGTALSFNRHGMVFSMDGLYVDFVIKEAAPRMFLNRSIIKARSFEETIELIKNKGFGLAYAFNVNLADLKSPFTMWAIETAPGKDESLYHVTMLSEESDTSKPCHYIHINNFKHLKTREIPNLKSSLSRTKTAESFPPPKNREDALTILGDQSNEQYPIYRTDRPTDHSATAFTGVVDILHNRVDVYVVNPAQKDIEPLLYFNILDV